MVCWAQSCPSLNLGYCRCSKSKHLNSCVGRMSVLASLSDAHLFVVCLSSSLDVVLFCQVLGAEQDTSSSFEGVDNMPHPDPELSVVLLSH